jgi:hypothetical protein
MRLAPTPAQIDQASEELIYALARRIIVYRFAEFDRVWQSANKICDRYETQKAA